MTATFCDHGSACLRELDFDCKPAGEFTYDEWRKVIDDVTDDLVSKERAETLKSWINHAERYEVPVVMPNSAGLFACESS